MEQTDIHLEGFTQKSLRGNKRKSFLQEFATYLQEISKKVGFKLSSRGWCYQLEGFNVINKGQFDKCQKYINEARKKGFLPIDFVAEESARKFQGILEPTTKHPAEQLLGRINRVLQGHQFYFPDYWEDEEYYIQMLVEKIDLVTLFEPICVKYHIPIANSRGWSSILQRAEMALRFKEHEEKGSIPVLLYYGDHDPFGLAISDFLVKNLEDIAEAVEWTPENLIIDRFGLNHDFIQQFDLTWIDNLTTGTGKKPDYKNPIVIDYIKKYGERKVEANAVVIIPKEVRTFCEMKILEYLTPQVHDRYAVKKKAVIEQFDEILDENKLTEPLTDAMKRLAEYLTENGLWEEKPGGT